MAITYVTHADAASNTVALPSYSTGDIALVWAFRDGSTTAPTDDANYTTLASSGANTCSLRIAARKLTTGDPNPSFTNATEIGVVILRASAGEFAGAITTLFGTPSVTGASSVTMSYLVPTTLKSNGLLVAMGGHRAATDVNAGTTALMTKRAPTTNTLGLHTALCSAGATPYAIAGSTQSYTVNSSSGWRSYTVEVLGNRTKMFPHSALSDIGLGTQRTTLSGATPTSWNGLAINTVQGTSATTHSTPTVNGPTAGIEDNGTTFPVNWISAPLDANVTIAAPIESNLRMSRSSASNNMGPQIVIERIDAQGVVQETVLNSEMGTENASTETVMNWSALPTSTAFNRGDRIRVRVAYNDAGGTASTGGTETFWFDGAAGATGDSYIIFGDSLTFAGTPAGTTIYPTTVAMMDYSAVVLADAPVAYWRLDGASGNAVDLINGLVGTYGGTVTRNEPGAVIDGNTCFKPAASGRVTVSNDVLINLADGPFSYEVWAKLTAIPGVGDISTLFSQGSDGEGCLRSWFGESGLLSFDKSGAGGTIVKSTVAIADAAWHHFVLTKDGAASIAIYQDGVSVGGTITNLTLNSGTGSFRIGAADGDTFQFNGWLDEMAIYSKVLTATQVLTHYEAGRSYLAWTSRGSGATTAVRNTTAGWTTPLQITDVAGGTVLEWFTEPLVAFTLGGPVTVNVRGLESNAAANTSLRVEVAVCAADTSGATIWATLCHDKELTTSEAAYSFTLAGADTAVTSGQRLRIRVYIDDASEEGAGSGAMGASQTATLYYAGTSGGASGDTYLTFSQTLMQLFPIPRAKAVMQAINRATF